MNTVNIFLSATADYFVHVFELLFSIRINSTKQFNVYLMVDSKDVAAAKVFFTKYVIPGINIVEIYDTNLLDSLLSPKHSLHLTKMTYGRIAAFKLLPQNIDTLFYFDLDMLVISKEIDKLFDIDLTGKYAAVCREISIELFAKFELERCGHLTKYFNAGLMAMNMREIRKNGIDSVCLELLENPPDFCADWSWSVADQTLMNIAFKENVIWLDPKYNIQAILMGYPQYEQYAKSYGYKDIVDFINHCVVSHMQGEIKPWSANWNSQEHWQAKVKQWQYDIYWKLRKIIETHFPGIYQSAN